MAVSSSRRLGVRGWALWSLPSRACAYVLAVDTTALIVLVLLASRTHWRIEDVLIALVFLGCGTISVEVFRRNGHLQHRPKDTVYYDLLSAFVLPAVFALPPFWAACLPLAMHALLQARSNRMQPMKRVFNTAIGSLACVVAAEIYDLMAAPFGTSHSHLSGMSSLAVVAAVATYVIINLVLVAGIIKGVAPATSFRSLLGGREQWVMTTVDVSSGVVLALVFSATHWLVPFAVIPILVLQRAVVHTHLVEASRHETKTGLANPTWWRQQANAAVVRARQSGEKLAVVLIDLDGFKEVNDCFGHLTGDIILSAVADNLRASVRPGDLVGRFGGDEFCILLREVAIKEAIATADRIRTRVQAISHPVADGTASVTASVGVALFGPHGTDVDGLLSAADEAMYRAKSAGGNAAYFASSGAEPTTIDLLSKGIAPQ